MMGNVFQNDLAREYRETHIRRLGRAPVDLAELTEVYVTELEFSWDYGTIAVLISDDRFISFSKTRLSS